MIKKDSPSIIQLPKISDPRGNLTFIEGGGHIPFKINRVYWTYDVPGGEKRGGHAHRELQEFFISLSGSFDVVVENLPMVIGGSISIRATADAKRVYETMLYHITLEIYDSDRETGGGRRKLIYNFPQEYVRKKEIELNQPEVIAQFKLIPLPSAEPLPGE